MTVEQTGLASEPMSDRRSAAAAGACDKRVSLPSSSQLRLPAKRNSTA
jgi:hypothetical protein